MVNLKTGTAKIIVKPNYGWVFYTLKGLNSEPAPELWEDDLRRHTVLLDAGLENGIVLGIEDIRWVEAGAVPILILLCLSAIPRVFAESHSQLLRVLDKPNIDFYWNILFTGLFTLAIFIGLNWSLMGVASGVLLVHLLAIPVFAYWAYRRYLNPEW